MYLGVPGGIMPRIMTVDDSLLVRSIITAALNERGFEMVEASDGVEGLEKLDSEEIDLVLLDVMMPGMDGPTMLQRMRAQNDQTPVILLTAKTETSVIRECLRYGLADCIVKPVKNEELANKVEQLLGIQEGVVVAAPGDAGKGVDSSPRVLIVDDSEKVHIKFRSLLPKEFNVFTAATADEAKSVCSSEEIGWIVVDMVIPEVDSVELAKSLKEQRPDASCLALYLRNVDSPELEASNAGLDGFLNKPFREGQIEDLIRLANSKMDPSMDILSVKENIVRVEKTTLKDEMEDQYFSRLAELVGLALDDIASDCFETVIFEFTNLVEHNQSQMLLSLSLQCSRDLGLDVCVVGPARLKEWIAEDEDPASIKFFETLMEASRF